MPFLKNGKVLLSEILVNQESCDRSPFVLPHTFFAIIQVGLPLCPAVCICIYEFVFVCISVKAWRLLQVGLPLCFSVLPALPADGLDRLVTSGQGCLGSNHVARPLLRSINHSFGDTQLGFLGHQMDSSAYLSQYSWSLPSNVD